MFCYRTAYDIIRQEKDLTRKERAEMNTGITLAPMQALETLVGSQFAARNFRLYYPLFAILMLALAVNIILLVWHRKKEKQNHNSDQA